MSNRVLLVDDEASLLQSLRRNLRGKYDLTLAEGGQAGLEQLKNDGPFAIVVSDMQMPEVNGVTLLSQARAIAPDTVRIMLTGNVDQQTAVEAVNQGAVFRFVNKPCPAENLATVLDEGLRQYSLVNAEKQLLSQTLTGAVAMVTELLSMANPIAFGRAGRLRSLAKRFATHLGWDEIWQYEIAAMLSQVGCIGHSTSHSEAAEMASLRHQAELSASLVGRIPRLERVAAMIGWQHAASIPQEVDPIIIAGAQLLTILGDFDRLSQGRSASQVVRAMESQAGRTYDLELLTQFSEMILDAMEIRAVQVHELVPNMILNDNVLNLRGDVLISQGHELTESLIQRLHNFNNNSVGVRQPIGVRCPRRS